MNYRNHKEAKNLAAKLAAFFTRSTIDLTTVPMHQAINVFNKSQLEGADLTKATGRVKYRLRSMGAICGTCEVCGQYVKKLFSQTRHPELNEDGLSFFSFISPGYFSVTGHEKCLRALRMHQPSELELVYSDKSSAEISIYKSLPFKGIIMSENQLQKNLAALPELVYIDNSDHRVPGAPKIIAVKRGESGYFPIQTSLSVEDLNFPLNVTREQIEAMFIGSMFGWDVPGAHPDAHKKFSTEIVDKTVHKDDETSA